MRFRSSLLVLGLALNGFVSAETLNADELAQLVNERPANSGRVGTMHFELTNRNGRQRHREAVMIHSDREGDQRIGIFFTKPSMIQDTGFLSLDAAQGDDTTWLYLPTTERVRRLPKADRSDYFMGTDLTYGDIEDDFSFNATDWLFSIDGSMRRGERDYPVLAGHARNAAVAKTLGYREFRAAIDLEHQFPIWIEYIDPQGDPLKIVQVHKIEKVGTAPTAMAFEISNIQTQHTTHVHFTQMRYVPELDDALFDPDALAFGVPDIE